MNSMIFMAGFLLQCVNGQDWGLEFEEPHGDGSLLLSEGEEQIITYNFTVFSTKSASIFTTSTDTKVVDVIGDINHSVGGGLSVTPNVTVRGVFLGRASVTFQVNRNLNGTVSSTQTKGGNSWYELPVDLDVVVKKQEGVLNKIFQGSVIVLVCVANIAMGCKTDVQVVKETLRTPIAPLTGLASQFILMPLISFTVGYLLQLTPPMAFGLFAMGCSPGGAASNFYTYFLDGNVSLSVTMTLVSTIASLAFIPLWLFTLGIHVIYRTETVTIPFVNIFVSLVGLIIPVGIGIIIQKKLPKVAKLLLRLLRGVIVIFFILVFTIGIYANLYIFRLMTPFNLLAGALLPYVGFLFGGIVALLTRRNKSDILTIAIETGIQNSGVAIVLLQLSLPHPDSDIAIVAPVNCSLFTPIPVVIAIIVHVIRKRWFRKDEDKDTKQEVGTANEDADQNVSLTFHSQSGKDGEEGDTREGLQGNLLLQR
ncbi:ileal sodium/bile acid cotransporter-like [Mizuhopecten yessoensis]|uniref:Ileal sodium/bile acid cotransporter n=1 Tax=Mizuhopecten yessoensis TaxID=6573 RepID=A0A210PN77_MIZYE|nr:ileal sodium/bile acid cotransporter-like [Mizuhopecten yessoensis]OWF37931.1 Ileal sodium/bile acid cotransporter [Mizuhopecten yessoensis]